MVDDEGGHGIGETLKEPQVFSGAAKPEGKRHCPSCSSQRYSGLSWTLHLVQARKKTGTGLVVPKAQAVPDRLELLSIVHLQSCLKVTSQAVAEQSSIPQRLPQALFSPAPQS